MTTIDSFSGTHSFLSNFRPSRIVIDGHAYPTVEHAFQAAKALDADQHDYVAAADTPFVAKRRGKSVKLRPDWEGVKLQVMEQCLREKFKDPQLRQQLLDTGDNKLIEGNTWNDTFWGVCRGKGQNHLGRLLMKIRDEIRAGG